MGFKGSLDSINLADIFQNLSINQQSGTLRISDNEAVRYIYFERGQVRYLSRGRGRGLELDGMLLGRGLVNKQQVEGASKKAQSSQSSVCQILTDSGLVSPEQIGELSRIRIEEDIFELFSWSSGQFEFMDGAPPGDIFDAQVTSMHVQLNTNSLIMEAARRIDEWERIRQKIPSTREIFVPAPGAGEGEELNQVEKRVLQLLDGTRDVDDLVSASAYSRYEVAQALCRFLDTNWIRSAAVEELKRGVAQARNRGDIPQTVKLYERILSLGSEDFQVRRELAEACAAVGDNEKAAIHFGVVADSCLAEDKEDEAIEIYQKVIQLVPKHVSSRDKLARIYAERGQKREAMEHYRVLVNAYIDTGRGTQAKAACSAALAIDPENVEIRGALAKVYLGEGNREAAMAEYEAVADSLASTGKVRAATDLYRRILHLDKNATQVRDKLAQVLSRDADYRRSRSRRRIVVGSILVVALAAAAVVGLEGWAKFQVDGALTKAKVLAAEQKYPDAVKVLDEALKRTFSPAMHYERALLEARDRCKDEQQKIEDRVSLTAQRERERVDGLLKEARAARNRQDLAAAMDLLRKVGELKATEEQNRLASALADEIKAQESYITDYLAWQAEHRKKLSIPGLGSAERLDLLDTEYQRVRHLLKTYPEAPQAKDAELPLQVRSRPEGANIFVDGRLRGPAPVELRYRPGAAVAVRAQKQGYAPKEEKITLHGSALLEFELQREAAWQADAGAPVYGCPLVVGGTVIVANRNGGVTAFDAKTGANLWGLKVPSAIAQVDGSLAEQGGKVFFGVSNGYVYAIDMKAPRGTMWSCLAGAAVRGTPTAVIVPFFNNRPYVFAGADDGRLYCIDAATGEQKWSTGSIGPIRTQPLVTSTYVYAGSDDAQFQAFDIITGQPKGSAFKAAGSIRAGVALAQGKVVFGDTAGWVYSFAADSPLTRPLWKQQVDGAVTDKPAVYKDALYVGTDSGRLYAFDAAQGKTLWQPAFSADAAIYGSPAASESRVYFGCADGWIYALDRQTGKTVWKYRTAREIRAGVTFSGGMLYAVSTDNYIYAFEEE